MARQAEHCIRIERLQVQDSSQKNLANEHYICLSQCQAKGLAQLMAMHYKSIHNVNILFAEPRPGYTPSLTYGLALGENNLEGNIQFAFAMNVGSLQPTLLAILSLPCGVQISKGVYKGK